MMQLLTKRTSFVVALSLYASTLEALLPHPLFLRYGFAYIPIMIFASSLNVKEFLVVILIKSLISGVLSLSLVSPFFLMTLVSSFLSGAIIFVFEKLREQGKMHITHIGVSVLSAFVSNLSQIAISYIVFFGDFSLFASPLVFVVGFVSSIIAGKSANKSENKVFDIYEKIDDISSDVRRVFDYKIRKKTILRFLLSYFVFILCLFISSLFRSEGRVLYSVGPIRICDISMYNTCIKALIYTLLFALSLVLSSFIVKRDRIKTSSVWLYYFYFTLNNPIANKNK